MKLPLNCRVLLFLLSLQVTFLVTFGRAQVMAPAASEVPNRIIKTTPLQLGEINLAYEFFREPDRSMQVGLGYIYTTFSDIGSFGEPVSEVADGVSVRISQRTYSGRKFASPQGGYRGPLATYRYMVLPDAIAYDGNRQIRDYKLSQQVLSLQYIWGIQRVFNNLLVVDTYMGLGGRLKYVYENIDSYKDQNYYADRSYGKEINSGPDWALLIAPSISLNFSIGLAF